jgi:1,4-dihydroxy-2-naphthoate octaprenyltransferase
MNFKFWFLAARPKTLTAAVVPVVASAAWVYSTGHEHTLMISVLALLSSLFIQIATNLFNDALDFKKGADDSNRLGPVRMTASGSIQYRAMIRAAIVSLALALICGIPLVIHGGLPILAIGLVSLILAYAYTGGPFPLAYKGLGDVFVVLFFGIIPVLGMIYLQMDVWPKQGLLLGLQIGLHCAVLIAINNLRDIEGDTRVGKKTLAVRLGKGGARGEITCLVVLPYLLGIAWIYPGYDYAAILPLLTLPLAVRLLRAIFRTEPSAAYNRFLGMSAALHLLFGLLLSLGFLISG